MGTEAADGLSARAGGVPNVQQRRMTHGRIFYSNVSEYTDKISDKVVGIFVTERQIAMVQQIQKKR